MIQNIKIIKTTKMMRTMKSIKKIVLYFFIVDIVLIVLSFVIGGKIWLINSQVAFISSLLITLSSFRSYQKLVQSRSSEYQDEKINQRDELDKIDDPYELHDEIDFKEVIKKERKKITNFKNSVINLKNSSISAFSPLRLGSYLFLFVLFLYLVKQDIFSVIPYMIGLFIVPIVSIASLLMQKS